MKRRNIVRPAIEADIPAWLAIAAEVEPLFGPMPDLAALMRAIRGRWDDGAPIDVVTFGADHPGGTPARALYRAHGLRFAEHADNRPEGGSRERWTRL